MPVAEDIQVEVIEIEEEIGSVFVLEYIIEIGEVGFPGPEGPAGPAGGAEFEQEFSSPLIQWLVNHNLGKRPVVSVMNTGGIEVIADIQHTSINQLVVNFSSAIAGRIRCV